MINAIPPITPPVIAPTGTLFDDHGGDAAPIGLSEGVAESL